MKTIELKGCFTIDNENKTVTYTQKTKGEYLTGTAKTNDGEQFDEVFGKALAFFRYELAVRKRDLKSVRYVIETLRAEYDKYEKEGTVATRNKMWDHFLQEAYEQERIQLDHIHTQEAIIHAMCEYGHTKEELSIDVFDREMFPDHEYIIQNFGTMLSRGILWI